MNKLYKFFCNYANENDNIDRLDYIIKFCFCILILLSILFSFIGISFEIIKLTTSLIQNNVKELKPVFVLIEMVLFFLMVPFFILTLFTYYLKSIELAIKSKSIEAEDSDKAIRSFNIFKSMFISSIMSYVLIKILEELSNNCENCISKIHLVSYGLIVLMLMAYLIVNHLLDRSHKSELKPH